MVGIGRYANTPRRLRLGMVMFLCAGLLMVLVGLAGAALRPGSLLDTAGSEKLPSIRLGLAGLGSDGEVNANALASAVLLVMPLGVSVLVLGKRQKGDSWTLLPAALAVVALGAVTLVLSHSRTALAAVWLIAVGLLVGGMRPWFCRVFAGIVVVAPMLLMTGRLPFLTQEVALRDANNTWVSTRGRAQLLSQGLDRLRQSPWLGIGLNEFRHVYAPRPGDLPQGDDVAHVHNIVLQTALDIGLVGSAAYWGLLVVLWVRATEAARGVSRLARTAAVGSAFALVAVSLFGLTDAVTLGSKVGTLQWAAGGLILAAWQIRDVPSGAGDEVAVASAKRVATVSTTS
jgi:O-antigen ligase